MEQNEIIDATKVIDLVKLKCYNEYLFTSHLYDEAESEFHRILTEQVVAQYIDTMELDKGANIIDIGCGPGYFMDEMKKREFTNVRGLTLSQVDYMICKNKGHKVDKLDISFLPSSEGFDDESADLLFVRHALEHSPYPIFSLMEYNRVLKQNGKIYIEVPAPDCERQHEYNLNHYSILGAQQLAALLIRTGFTITLFNNLEFDLKQAVSETEEKTFKEKYYCIVAKKTKPLDIK